MIAVILIGMVTGGLLLKIVEALPLLMVDLDHTPVKPEEWLAVIVFTGVLFGVLYSTTVAFVIPALGCSFLLLITLIDLRYRLILNIMIYPAFLLILLVQLANGQAQTVIIGGVFAFAIFYMVRWLQPGQLGGGDVKLAALLGVWFGFPHILPVLLIGTGTGAVSAISIMMIGHKTGKQTIPYAPFLCLGALALILFRGANV